MRVSTLWYQIPSGFRIAIVFAATASIWELVCQLFAIRPYLLPAPSQVVEAFFQAPHIFLKNSWDTFHETVLGFLLAVGVGMMLAIAIITSRFFEETLYTLLVTMNAVPKIAIAPLFVVWLGTGLAPKVAISALISVFVIVVNLVLGLQSIDPEMVDLARSLKGSSSKTLLKVRLPHALPHLFSGMKVCTTLALTGSIVGEFVSADRGLGYMIMVAQAQFDTPTIFAAIVALSIMGTILFFAVDVAERLLLPWHASHRRPVSHGGRG
jgi:NitT/TauT family transport system permease protein